MLGTSFRKFSRSAKMGGPLQALHSPEQILTRVPSVIKRLIAKHAQYRYSILQQTIENRLVVNRCQSISSSLKLDCCLDQNEDRIFP